VTLSSETVKTRERYDRIAGIYDRIELLAEPWIAPWRRLLWSKAPEGRILELGVGTGRNFPYYPKGADVIAIDISERMLSLARRKAAQEGVAVTLERMDAQALSFPDDSFDAVVASFVFCSVPDPVLGLKEAARVCKPGGWVLLLEHVLSGGPLGLLMRLMNPLVVRLWGANMDRRTVENVLRADLELVDVTNLLGDVVKLIEARPKK